MLGGTRIAIGATGLFLLGFTAGCGSDTPSAGSAQADAMVLMELPDSYYEQLHTTTTTAQPATTRRTSTPSTESALPPTTVPIAPVTTGTQDPSADGATDDTIDAETDPSDPGATTSTTNAQILVEQVNDSVDVSYDTDEFESWSVRIDSVEFVTNGSTKRAFINVSIDYEGDSPDPALFDLTIGLTRRGAYLADWWTAPCPAPQPATILDPYERPDLYTGQICLEGANLDRADGVGVSEIGVDPETLRFK